MTQDLSILWMGGGNKKLARGPFTRGPVLIYAFPQLPLDLSGFILWP